MSGVGFVITVTVRVWVRIRFGVRLKITTKVRESPWKFREFSMFW